MPFKYACFISYPHSLQGELAERFIKDLYTALSSEIENFMDLNVFVDPMRLKGGEFFNDALAKALCESICMISVITPVYFNKNKPFTAREYKAMEKLEEQRLDLLPPGKRERGLIIPIVLRGERYLPSSIRTRYLYDFSDYLIVDEHLYSHPRYSRSIYDIASYIHELYLAFSKSPQDLCRNCDTFTLPSEAEVLAWLDQNPIDKIPFPLR